MSQPDVSQKARSGVSEVAEALAPSRAIDREQRIGRRMVWGGIALALFTIGVLYVTERDGGLNANRPGSTQTVTNQVKPIPF